MTRQTRTNPVYAQLARRRAIIGHVVSLLSSDYTSSMGDEQPERVIHADDVFPEDNPVPEEDIQGYIGELELEGEQLRLEMLKFNFVKQDEKTSQVRKRPAKKKTTRRKGNGKAGQAKR
jgi:hypothetical protein